MATLTAIRDAIKTLVKVRLPELTPYDTVPDVAQVPAIVLEPGDADFSVAMGRGKDVWDFMMYILVGRTEVQEAQRQLDLYVSGGGDKSIRQLLFQEGDDLLPATQIYVTGLKGYGGSFNSANIPHVGAILMLKVHTSGKE